MKKKITIKCEIYHVQSEQFTVSVTATEQATGIAAPTRTYNACNMADLHANYTRSARA